MSTPDKEQIPEWKRSIVSTSNLLTILIIADSQSKSKLAPEFNQHGPRFGQQVRTPQVIYYVSDTYTWHETSLVERVGGRWCSVGWRVFAQRTTHYQIYTHFSVIKLFEKWHVIIFCPIRSYLYSNMSFRILCLRWPQSRSVARLTHAHVPPPPPPPNPCLPRVAAPLLRLRV